MISERSRNAMRELRHRRLRRDLSGTAERPRLSVFVSNQHLYVQFIDDAAGKTLAAVSTLAGSLKGQKLNVATAKQLGALAAQAAKEKGISAVVFDRGGFAYRGRLQALADAARESGLKF